MARYNDLPKKVIKISSRFPESLDAFDQSLIFSGPSVYFHQKAIAQRRTYTSAARALDDPAFIESIYATLTAWGMHRMGKGNARLVDFPNLCNSFQRARPLIQQLEGYCLWALPENQLLVVTNAIWEVINLLEVGIGGVKIVSGSKALHHILPELAPPIDRQYTLQYFLGKKNIKQRGEEEFKLIFPCFVSIAIQNRSEIEKALARGGGMNTSLTKVIDNAIVGYQVISGREPERNKGLPEPLVQAEVFAPFPKPIPPGLVIKFSKEGPVVEQILWAVGQLVAQGQGVFTKLEIREILQVEGAKFNAVYGPCFQGMRTDQPGGAPKVRKEFKGVFRQVQHGVFCLTEYGQQLIGAENF
jgi:hypothetical protein